MSDTKPLLSRRLDRRAFLGGAGLAAGAVVATALVPLSIVHSVSSQAAVALTPNVGDPGYGHVDDAWGHWPPYSHPIPYSVAAVPAGMETLAGNAHPADYFLIA